MIARPSPSFTPNTAPCRMRSWPQFMNLHATVTRLCMPADSLSATHNMSFRLRFAASLNLHAMIQYLYITATCVSAADIKESGYKFVAMTHLAATQSTCVPLSHAASMHDISRLDFAACVDVHQAVTCPYMPNAWSSATYKAASACTVRENQGLAYHSHMQMHALSHVCKAQLHNYSSRKPWLCCHANVSWATLLCTELHAHYRRLYKPDNT